MKPTPMPDNVLIALVRHMLRPLFRDPAVTLSDPETPSVEKPEQGVRSGGFGHLPSTSRRSAESKSPRAHWRRWYKANKRHQKLTGQSLRLSDVA